MRQIEMFNLKFYDLKNRLQVRKLYSIISLQFYCKWLNQYGIQIAFIEYPSAKQTLKIQTSDFITKQQNESIQNSTLIRKCPICNQLEYTVHINCRLKSV